MDINCRNITNISKNSDKNLFIKNLSVELVNTLNGLSGFLSLFDKDNLSQRDKELLSQAEYAAFVLLHQVNSLKYLHEAVAFSPQINFLAFNLHEIVSNSLLFFKDKFYVKDLNLVFNFDEEISFDLYGDSLKLNELINCFVENVFILADNNVELNVRNIGSEEKIRKIRFEFIFDSFSFYSFAVSKNFDLYSRQNFSFNANIKKVDINFAIANELLRQLGSELVCDVGENNKIIIAFELDFFVEKLGKLVD